MEKHTRKVSKLPYTRFKSTLCLTQALTAGAGQIIITPGGGNMPQVSSVADGFGQYRLVSVDFQLRVPVAAPTGQQGACWLEGANVAAPATIANLVQTHCYCLMDPRQTVATPVVRVPKRLIRGPTPWYKTFATSSDLVDEVAGTIYVVGTGTDAFSIVVNVVYEFDAPCATAQTPELRAALRDREDALLAARARRGLELLNKSSVATTLSLPSTPDTGGIPNVSLPQKPRTWLAGGGKP